MTEFAVLCELSIYTLYILVFLTLEKWVHSVWLHLEKEYCPLKGISFIHSTVFDLPEL